MPQNSERELSNVRGVVGRSKPVTLDVHALFAGQPKNSDSLVLSGLEAHYIAVPCLLATDTSLARYRGNPHSSLLYVLGRHWIVVAVCLKTDSFREMGRVQPGLSPGY